ncbi:hypothetical protein [Sphingomonas floccifaciens]
MHVKLHAVADGNGCPSSFCMPAGRLSDYTSAETPLDDMPKVQ